MADEKNGDLDQIRALASEAGAPEGTAVEAVRWLVAENARLASLADEGRQYRADLVNAAIVEGVRAMGKTFPEETYRKMLATAPLEQVKSLIASWGGQAQEIFTGGRKTVDEEKPQRTQQVVPDSAYKS